MKGPSLQKSAAVSAVLHLTFFLLSALILKQSARTALPSPYIVSLIGPVSDSRDAVDDRPAQTVHKPAENARDEKNTKIGTQDTKTDQRVKDEIAAIAAKKKLADLAKLKRDMLNIKGRADQTVSRPVSQTKTTGPSQGSTLTDKGRTGTGSYEDKVTAAIWREWVYPDTQDKNLEAIVAVKILRDGSIIIQGLEKKSGSLLFDRSALKAIAKASPVTPPLQEMELGIRFYP